MSWGEKHVSQEMLQLLLSLGFHERDSFVPEALSSYNNTIISVISHDSVP